MMEHDRACMRALGLGESDGLTEAVRPTAHVQGAKSFIKGNALGAAGGHEAVARQAKAAAVELKAKLVVTGFTRAGIQERRQPGKALQVGTDSARAFTSLGVAGVELFQLRQQHGGLQLRERTEHVA